MAAAYSGQPFYFAFAQTGQLLQTLQMAQLINKQLHKLHKQPSLHISRLLDQADSKII